jgi:hypothetical protein
MDDQEILGHINELIDEEHQLERSHVGRPPTAEELERLDGLERTLDRLWDLLRQRRARRDANRDPDTAVERPESVVEGYQQ